MATRTTSDPAAAAGPPGAAVWRLRLFGDFELQGLGRRHDRLAGRAMVMLLVRLALWPGRAHPREALIDLLWPNASAESGRNRLRHTLSILRGLLEPPGPASAPVLLADRQAIRLVPGAVDCDVVAFDARIRAGDGNAALALYRGELLPGFYDEWIQDERMRLAALHERLVRAEPSFLEPPQAEPRDSDERPLLRLPAYLTPVFGIAGVAAALCERLRAHRLVTLLGPGGSGKTRLAVEVGRALRETPTEDAGFDLIGFVALADCTTRQALEEAIVAALQLAAPADGPAWLAIERALLGRRALLVLDNFEQLVDLAGDLPARLGSSLPCLHLLITSRRALGLDGEQLVELAPLPLPPPEASLQEAAGSSAVALFVERARASRATFGLSTGNVQVLVELVAELEGMPLAIELAATRIRTFSPADLLARLRASRLSAVPVAARLDLLARPGGRSGFDARHASMRNVIDWSWRQLPPAAAGLLEALSVFRGGFSAAAAVAVFDDPGSDIALLLDELLAHSLLRTRGDAVDSPRFELDEPIREFAALKSTRAGEWRRRHRDWALGWARALPATPPLDAIRRELPNLHAAWSSALEDRCPDVGVALLLALEPAWYHVDPPASVLTVAIACVRDQRTRPDLRAPALSLLALLLQAAGQVEPALSCAEEGLAAAAATGEPRVRALYALARVRWRHLHRADAVRPLLDEADRLADRLALAEPMLRARVHSLRASIASRADRDHAAAEALHLRALEAWRRGCNLHAVNAGRYALAVSAQNAGRNALALQRLDEVMQQAAAQDDRRTLAQALNVRGNALCGLRRWADAARAFRESARVAWQALAFYELAFVFWNIPRALAHLRSPQDAVRLAGFAERYWTETGGVLTPSDHRDQRRLRRLAACQLGRSLIAELWAEGRGWSVQHALRVVVGTTAAEAVDTPAPGR